MYLCSFHREQAWERWTSRKESGLNGEERQIALNLMRKIAHSESIAECQGCITVLQNSLIWNKYAEFRKWFTKTWLKCTWRWVRAYLSNEFDTMVTTTNGVESLNKLLKYNFLPHSPDKTLSSLVKVLIEHYYPSAISQYYGKNVKFSGINRTFNANIPQFMHGRPTSFIKQCYKAYKAAELDVNDCTEDQLILSKNANMIYDVKSAYGSNVYQVDWKKPFCSCPAFANFKPYPCKHFFILTLMLKELTWENLPYNYINQSLFIADTEIPLLINNNIVQNEANGNVEQQLLETAETEDVIELSDEDSVTIDADDENDNRLSEIPSKKNASKKAILKLITSKTETIKSDAYLCHDYQVLDQVSALLDSCIDILQENIPKEESIKLEANDLPQKKTWQKKKRLASQKSSRQKSAYLPYAVQSSCSCI